MKWFKENWGEMLKIIYNIFFGLILVTGIVVVIGLPVFYLLTKIPISAQINNFLNSPFSGYLLIGVVIGLFIACWPKKN